MAMRKHLPRNATGPLRGGVPLRIGVWCRLDETAAPIGPREEPATGATGPGQSAWAGSRPEQGSGTGISRLLHAGHQTIVAKAKKPEGVRYQPRVFGKLGKRSSITAVVSPRMESTSARQPRGLIWAWLLLGWLAGSWRP